MPPDLVLHVDNYLSKVIDLLKGLLSTASCESEDYLFTNAFAPADPYPSRAVLLFISGGVWQQGNGEIDLSGLAEYEDIVVLTFNYRTNAECSCLWCLSNVTIWGESAGAMSAEIHVNRYTSPSRAAMIFSGQIKKRVMPITDNVIILSARSQRWRDGNVARVPVLMWTVAEEGRGLINRNISLETLFGAYISTTRQQRQILDAYPSLKTEFDTAAAIYTDVVWQCPQAILANIFSFRQSNMAILLQCLSHKSLR
ncbi:cholinesterase [Fusarium circinatum]|uniref:Cholinesterase n=1 Tax=Fusarium circinatum TaxID=48490 RepID=A0A8H5TX39_FUSCI|nr:cholinesterase [Fusarium circinatum]